MNVKFWHPDVETKQNIREEIMNTSEEDFGFGLTSKLRALSFGGLMFPAVGIVCSSVKA